MTSQYRCIKVECCKYCPYFLDVTSFGKPAAKCGNSPRGIIITPEEQKGFPDWCPLQAHSDFQSEREDWQKASLRDSERFLNERVGTDGLTDAEYEHQKLVEEIEILHDRLQSEREKVLDELVSWLNLGNLELEKHFPCDRLMIKLRELRKGGERE